MATFRVKLDKLVFFIQLVQKKTYTQFFIGDTNSIKALNNTEVTDPDDENITHRPFFIHHCTSEERVLLHLCRLSNANMPWSKRQTEETVMACTTHNNNTHPSLPSMKNAAMSTGRAVPSSIMSIINCEFSLSWSLMTTATAPASYAVRVLLRNEQSLKTAVKPKYNNQHYNTTKHIQLRLPPISQENPG